MVKINLQVIGQNTKALWFLRLESVLIAKALYHKENLDSYYSEVRDFIILMDLFLIIQQVNINRLWDICLMERHIL